MPPKYFRISMNLELLFEVLLIATVEMTLIIIPTCVEAQVGLTLREIS
jgi:hypothetical protein